MNIYDMFPSRWVKAHDLDGKQVNVTIEKVTLEEMHGEQGEEVNPVVWFKGAEKGLIMNKTIATQIASLHGPETDTWKGKRITLYPTRVKAFNEWHDVIRVRPQIPVPPQSAAQAQDEAQGEAQGDG